MKKMFHFILLMLITAPLLIACGGGGVGSGGGGDQKATINQGTAQQIIGITLLSNVIAGISSQEDITLMGNGNSSVMNVAGSMLNIADSRAAIKTGEVNVMGADSYLDNCTDGGIVIIELTWDGPDSSQNCSDIINPEINFNFQNCIEGSLTMNGSFTVAYAGDMCSFPSDFTATFSNFSLNETSEGVSFAANNFSIVYSEVSIDGDESFITHMKAVLNGDFSAESRGNSYSSSYKDLQLISDTNDNFDIQLRFDGSVMDDCLNGWATVSTLEPVLINVFENCPTGGKLKIAGKEEMVAEFLFDGSVDIEGVVYNSCEDLRACILGSDDYCTDYGPCGEGEGDCDDDSECKDGLVCVDDVGADYGLYAGVDVCETPDPYYNDPYYQSNLLNLESNTFYSDLYAKATDYMKDYFSF